MGFKKGYTYTPKNRAKVYKSYKKAVIYKCKECIYDPLGKGTWLYQITNCSSPTCPLFGVRPTNDSREVMEG